MASADNVCPFVLSGAEGNKSKVVQPIPSSVSLSPSLSIVLQNANGDYNLIKL